MNQFCVVFLSALILLTSSASAQIKYQIKEAYSYYEDKILMSINNQGNGAGWFIEETSFFEGLISGIQERMFPFYTEDGVVIYSTISVSYPPPSFVFGTWSPSLSIRVNQNKEIAYTSNGKSGIWPLDQLILWTPGQNPKNVGAPEGWSHFEVVFHNDSGQVLLKNLGSSREDKAFVALWSEGKFTLIPSLQRAATLTNEGLIYGNLFSPSEELGHPIIYDVHSSSIKILNCPPYTEIFHANDHGKWVGVVYDHHFKKPLRAVFGLNDSEYRHLPEDFFPFQVNNKGCVFGVNGKGEYVIFELETNEVSNPVESIVDAEGNAILMEKLRLISMNEQGELLFRDKNWNSLILSPVIQ